MIQLAAPVIQELDWRPISEGRVLPLPVVENLNVFEAGCLHVAMGGTTQAMYPFILKAVEPALSRRVIPKITLSAHRTGHAECLELVLKGMAGVLAPLVRVMHQTRCRAFSEPGHSQCICHDIRRHA